MAQAGTQTKPTGNAHDFIEGTCAVADDTITLSLPKTTQSFGIQLSGTWSGTVTFEVSGQGGSSATWVTAGVFPSATPTASIATTATANGQWGRLAQGERQVRARFSTATSGTVTVSINALMGQF